VSSHILYEVEQLTENILLLHRGRLLAQGNLHGIRDLMDRHPPPHRDHDGRAARARDARAALLACPPSSGVRMHPAQPGRLEVETNQPGPLLRAVPRRRLAGDFAVDSFHSPDNNLESVFRYLMNA
jgi:ABC-2 type transport system ATP-binding protein